jgi:hypothetical protein
VPTLAAYPGMMQRARKRERLRVSRAAWLVGVSVREYREIEAGDRTPSPGTYGTDLRAVRVAPDVALDLRRFPCGYRPVLVPLREDPPEEA